MNCNWLLLPVAAVLAFGHNPGAHAAIVLSATSTFTDIAITGPSCQAPSICEAQQEGLTFASVQLGNTFATADALNGVIRGFAESTGGNSGPNGAGTGATVEVKLLNNGASAVFLPAGALVFNVDSTFLRTVGILSGTTVATSFAYGSNPANTASASIQYQYFQAPSPGAGVVNLIENAVGGASIQINSASSSALDVAFRSGALAIQPGEELSASFLFQPTTAAVGNGAYAQIDATQTALFRLELPAGVVFDGNGLNVTWVSVVPESSALSMTLLGLGVIALARRRARGPST